MPLGAIACLGSAVATYSFASIADLMGTSLAAPTHSKCHAVPSSFEDVSTAGPANPKSSFLSGFSLLPRFFSLDCHADASGYNSLDASSTYPSLRLPDPHGAEPEADSDTITGVFHRLDPQRAKLLLVQVVFRYDRRRAGSMQPLPLPPLCRALSPRLFHPHSPVAPTTRQRPDAYPLQNPHTSLPSLSSLFPVGSVLCMCTYQESWRLGILMSL